MKFKGNGVIAALFFTVVAFRSTGCSDNIAPPVVEVKGCTDIAGLNFSRQANKDDGSCQYDSSRNYVMESFEVDVDATQRQVKILLQVKNEDGQGVVGLLQESSQQDFAIAENDRLVGAEAGVKIEADAIPFSIPTVLLLDLSSSVEGLVPQIKEAVITLINSKSANQTFAIYTFDSAVNLVQEFTGDVNLLTAKVNALPESGLTNSTNIFGAVEEVADAWEDEKSIDNIVDGSIVVFTDGFHNANGKTVQDALKALEIRSGKLKKIFVAALNSPDLDRSALTQLTFDTNGFFEANDVSGLEAVFLNIQERVSNLSNSIYFLTYTSPITDPKSKNEKLMVKIVGNSNKDKNGRVEEEFNSKGFGL